MRYGSVVLKDYDPVWAFLRSILSFLTIFQVSENAANIRWLTPDKVNILDTGDPAV